MARKTKDQEEQDLISEVQKFIQESESADSNERQLMLEDLRFVYRDETQWDQTTREARANRPCYTFNRVIGAVNQVIGDQRQASPQIKIRGTDGDSDPELAEVFSGLIRNIEDLSDAQTAYDIAFKHAVAGGYGAWRVLPEFKSDKSFEQEIFIKPVYNPFTVFWDPLAQDPRKRDQNKCAIAERISRDTHEALFGKKAAEAAKSVSVSRDSKGWFTKDQIRIAEYFKRVPVEKEIALLTDGRTVELTDEIKTALEEAAAANKKLENGEERLAEIDVDSEGKQRIRTAKTFQVKWWKVDGTQILDGPITYDWRFIPVVKMCGRFINIEGEHLSQSLVRHSKDAQRVYNYNRTSMSEVVGNAPRAIWLVTDKMISGREKEWGNANAQNKPVLRYNFDPDVPDGTPKRIQGAEIPAALASMAALDADDIKAGTGFFDASLGERGPQESGEAIRARQKEGDVGSFEFMDNFAKALQFTGEILVDMIPKVYDTKRTIRILGLDGKEKFETINAYDEARKKKLDMSAGRYDVTATIGPAFATQKREATRDLIDAMGLVPLFAEVGADLLAKTLDITDSDMLEERIRKRYIQEGIIEPTPEEAEKIPPPQPDPVQLALVAAEEAKAQALQAKAQKDAQAAQQAEAEMPIELLKQMEEFIGLKMDNRFKEEEIRLAQKEVGQIRINVDD